VGNEHGSTPIFGDIANKVLGRVDDVASKRIPQGLTQAQFDDAARLLRSNAGHLSDDIAVHGSRASGTAKATSDIDFAIRVSPEQFDELVKLRFDTPNPGSAKLRTMQHAIETGKIQAGEAGLSGIRRQLQKQLEMKVDLSVIKTEGAFDQGPYISIP
jgi:predicted nucleotidyltransferase